MAKKIIGWVLLAVGVLMILWGVWSSYQIFTGAKSAPEIFKAQKAEETAGGNQMENMIQEQLGKLLPTESIPDLLNLITWSVFATILMFGGGKIAFIGIKLLK